MSFDISVPYLHPRVNGVGTLHLAHLPFLQKDLLHYQPGLEFPPGPQLVRYPSHFSRVPSPLPYRLCVTLVVPRSLLTVKKQEPLSFRSVHRALHRPLRRFQQHVVKFRKPKSCLVKWVLTEAFTRSKVSSG